MKEQLDSLEAQLGSGIRDYQRPPLHLWQPPLSGELPIRISEQGIWYHDGGKIERQKLINLFASILRREEDGSFYLVTPVEKWRIQVEGHPLRIVDFDEQNVAGEIVLEATLNTGLRFTVNQIHPLFLDPEVGNIAAIRLPHGLTALCTRAVWYRLVERAIYRGDKAILKSGSYEFSLSGD
ncbi:MAG: DUF1285 domain-containing protein [Halioglobus sp.]